jgi:hypothetical protein
MARRIVDTLLAESLILPDVGRDKLAAEVEALLHEELSVEDRINEEVRQILGKFEGEIARGGADYRKVFELTKQKLVKEKDVIL